MFEPTFFAYEWDPFEEIDRVRRRVERALDGTARGLPFARVAAPRVDVLDSGPAFVIEAEVPGFKNADISVTVENDVVTLTGQRAAEPREGYSLHRRERAEAPKFSRSFTLPARVDAERVEAKLHDGILTVTLPKAAESRPRQINVKAS